MKKIVLVVFLGSSVLAFYFVFTSIPKSSSVGISKVSLQKQSEIGFPTRLIIPSINVDAAVQNIGLAADGSIGAPNGPYDVAWFDLGSKPGETGSAIISGHYGKWLSGANSVFDNLNKLKKGDKIYVKDDKGNTVAFTVQSSKIYNSNQTVPDLFKSTGKGLNLITCNGTWIQSQKTYSNRLVIYAEAL